MNICNNIDVFCLLLTRYDGIYKVVKYFPFKGKSGFIVWRYQLKRDDPVPAPWTKAGKERIDSLGLEMQVYIIVSIEGINIFYCLKIEY